MKLFNHTLTVLILFLSWNVMHAQSTITHIEPANWWAGMKNPKVQVLVHGENISALKPSIDYPGVRLERVIQVENANYLFLDIHIDKTAWPGNVAILFSKDGKPVITQNWPLWVREAGSATRKGFDNSDVLYLITPDRFANGNPDNDAIKGMLEKPDRSDPVGRHGGDIEGIRKQLNYFQDMGFTALWINPVLENDMPRYSYHGYAITDFYQVDRRYGSNESYQQLAREAKAKGIKMVMDMIANHCGSKHWWMDDMPTSDWLNIPDKSVMTNHRKSAIQDPHVSAIDKSHFVDGWFVPTMPDLNQRNPLLANYLIQNSIWWVEYAGLDGIRMDTYPYADMDYINEWARRILEEYPQFNIVGEEWSEDPTIIAFWQAGKTNANGYQSYLPCLMDFPLQFSLAKALNTDGGYNDDWMPLYDALSRDYLYADPNNLLVFPDNHDMPRYFAQVGEEYGYYELGMAYMLTTRGIPQIYYGTEVLMSSPVDRNDGLIRSDFPGGWAGDKANAFTGAGLNKQQLRAKAFLNKLLLWRKGASVVHGGKLMHFIPQDEVYVYFRYKGEQKVMVILNKNEKAQALELARFSEMLKGVSQGKNVLNGKMYPMKGKMIVPGREPVILELK